MQKFVVRLHLAPLTGVRRVLKPAAAAAFGVAGEIQSVPIVYAVVSSPVFPDERDRIYHLPSKSKNPTMVNVL